MNTSNTSDYNTSTLPTGWTTPIGGGLNLVTTYQVDNLGRTTEMTDPNGNVTYTVYNDALDPTTGFQNEVRTYSGWHFDSTTGLYTTTGPVQVTRYNEPGSYSETLTYAYAPVSGVTAPTGTDTINSANIQSLSRDLMNAAGQTIETDAYTTLSGVTYSAASAQLGAAGTNYNATLYSYDTDGNQDKVVDPNGTITRTVYDGQHRVVSTWVGTSDTPTTGYWSPTNNAGANMVEVSSDIYDNGGVGDSNLTQETEYPGGGETPRVTQTYFDWRDREVAAKAGVLLNEDGSEDTSAENDGTNRPITYTVYDNLDEPIEQDTYDGDGVAVTFTDGVPDAPDSTLLRAKSTTDYDDQGRAFQTNTYSVDPTTGTVGSALVGNMYYDLRSNVIATYSSGQPTMKDVYDGAGRFVTRYTTDGGAVNNSGSPLLDWSDADSVANDVVVSETDAQLDADGNPILTTTKDRLPTASGTTEGALTSGNARISYDAMYFDAADRKTAEENVGTNDGTVWTRPSTPDATDDSHLVTTTQYGSDGMPSIVTDPRGIPSLTEYDLLGQTIETIAALTDAIPTTDTNQTTIYTYDGNGDQTSMIAVEPSGTPDQTTDYIYGVAGGTSGIFSNDLLAKVEYPDAITGDASTSASDDVSYAYNALGEQTSMTDQNGTTHDYTRDVLGRETLDSVVTLGSSVDGSIRAIGTNYNSQGLPYQESSYSDAAGTTVANQDQDVYNGLGQLTGEYQSVSGAVDTSTTPEVQYGYSAPSSGSLMTSMTYPNGRELDYIYNSGLDSALGRVSSESDAGGSAAGTLQSYAYLGLSTVLGEADGNGVTETTTLDNFGRTAGIDYVNTAADSSTDDFAYGYDRDNNVLLENNLLNADESELYHVNSTATGDDNAAYDPLNRLVGFKRGALSSSGNNGSSPDTVASASTSQAWNLDAVGNQSSITTNGTATSNTTNSKNELSANGSNSLMFDNDGNTIADGSGKTYTFDSWNRLATAKDSAGAIIASYNYDAESRRIADTTAGQIRFYNGIQEIEDRDSSAAVTAQYVWSADGNIQELILRDDNSTPGGLGKTSSGLGERLYVQQDANGNAVALTSASGGVQQRFIYDPYGAQTVLTSSWGTSTESYNWVYAFQGGRLETATGLYHFSARDYDNQLARWMQADPAGYVAGANLYQFEVAKPVEMNDSTGLSGAATQPVTNPTGQRTSSDGSISIAPIGSFAPNQPGAPIIGTMQWRWSFNRNFPNQNHVFWGGQIVQHIEVTSEIFDCNGKEDKRLEKAYSANYWEAWEVTAKGEIQAKVDADKPAVPVDTDIFSIPSKMTLTGLLGQETYDTADTYGWIVAQGWAKFDDQSPIEHSMFGEHPFSGDLPSTTIRPKDWSDEGGLYHAMKLSWNNCCNPPTVTGSIGPKGQK